MEANRLSSIEIGSLQVDESIIKPNKKICQIWVGLLRKSTLVEYLDLHRTRTFWPTELWHSSSSSFSQPQHAIQYLHCHLPSQKFDRRTNAEYVIRRLGEIGYSVLLIR